MNVRLGKLLRLYKSFAVLLLNTFLVLAGLNLGAFAIVEMATALMPLSPVENKYGEKLERAYPSVSKEQMSALLAETWSRPVLYEAYTQFKERPYSGQFVNVSAFGNRLIEDQGPFPLDPRYYNVFVFGGSTTFGYGVADIETLPSFLQQELRRRVNEKIRVYNFGRGYYFSTQERILFEQLLASGILPQAAVFVDGLNEFVLGDGVPAFTGGLAAFMDGSHTQQAQQWYANLPVFQLVGLLQGYNQSFTGASATAFANTTPTDEASVYNEPAYLEKVIERYLVNKRMIQATAGLYGVRTVFVWQPVPTYKYDRSQHIFADAGFGVHSYSGYGYSLMKARLDKNTLGSNFLWCADIQQDAERLLYVDLVHYSPELNRMLAAHIGQLVFERQLLFVR